MASRAISKAIAMHFVGFALVQGEVKLVTKSRLYSWKVVEFSTAAQVVRVSMETNEHLNLMWKVQMVLICFPILI